MEWLVNLAAELEVDVDSLVIGRELGLPIRSTRRLKRVQGFNQEDQETIIRLLEAAILKSKVENAVLNEREYPKTQKHSKKAHSEPLQWL